MRYRGTSDRAISTYAALLIVAMVGAGSTFFILRTIQQTDFSYVDAEQQALLSL